MGGCSSGETGCTSTEHTTSYPPATIAGSINCSQTGNDGWCVGTASLSLSANEPLGGYSITLIEGTRNGETFACIGASCNVPLIEGQNDFTYWALSSWGDSSLMGASSGKLDSQPPQVGLSGSSSFCPDCGESLSVTLTVSDSTSGAASWTLTLDGATLTSGSGPASQTVPVPSAGLSAGAHILSLSASDVAGNTNATSLTFTLLLPTPTNTPVPTSTPKGGGGQSENPPPAGQPTSQSGSSSQEILATPTSLTSTPSPPSASQTTDSLPAIPVASSGQEGPVSGEENTIISQQGSSSMPPELADAILWGSMAAGAIGSTMVYVLEQEKKRKEEEALARAEAERANAEARAIEKGYDSYEDMMEAEAKTAFDAKWNAMLAVTQTTAAIQPRIASVRHLKERERLDQTPPPPSKSKKISPLLMRKGQGTGQLQTTPTLATLTPTPASAIFQPDLLNQNAAERIRANIKQLGNLGNIPDSFRNLYSGKWQQYGGAPWWLVLTGEAGENESPAYEGIPTGLDKLDMVMTIMILKELSGAINADPAFRSLWTEAVGRQYWEHCGKGLCNVNDEWNPSNAFLNFLSYSQSVDTGFSITDPNMVFPEGNLKIVLDLEQQIRSGQIGQSGLDPNRPYHVFNTLPESADWLKTWLLQLQETERKFVQLGQGEEGFGFGSFSTTGKMQVVYVYGNDTDRLAVILTPNQTKDLCGQYPCFDSNLPQPAWWDGMINNP